MDSCGCSCKQLLYSCYGFIFFTAEKVSPVRERHSSALEKDTQRLDQLQQIVSGLYVHTALLNGSVTPTGSPWEERKERPEGCCSMSGLRNKRGVGQVTQGSGYTHTHRMQTEHWSFHHKSCFFSPCLLCHTLHDNKATPV